ncbi:MAG TPA: hypothetical protein VKB84_00745 [Candidatus Binataceae bacterium]|nr:hypothetical protein [Candidatus Binataceae bacterium]
MPEPSDSAVRELARQILARREYGLVNENPTPAWVDWLRRFLAWIEILRVNSPGLYWAFIAALSILVLAAIAQIVWSVRAALRAQAPPAQPLSTDRRADLEGEASQLAGSGRFLEAAHRLMIACFGLLAERSVIELRPDCSNRWIRSALRGSALAEALAIEVGALVERTERRWFGNRDNEPDIYFQWRSVYRRLQSSGE